MNNATEPQINFIRDLMAERLEADKLAACLEILDAGIDSRNASAWIDKLKTMPKLATAKPKPAATNVPAGRYAVDIDGKRGFFVVDKPERGKWEGYTFVKQMASDDEHPVRGVRKDAVLAAIEADPLAAAVRYGQELGRCSICNRTLTDEASIAAGIGPVCAEKF